MTPIEDQARAVFLAALEHPPEQWPAFLDEACQGNAELRQRALQLLQSHQAIGSIHGGADKPRPTVDEPPAASPGVIGPYKLIEQIGEGGMGTVWMAQQTEPVKRVVALKLIKAGMDSKQVIARFEAERQALALMDHPNIAKVLDAGTTPPSPPSQGGDRIGSPPSQGGAWGGGRPYFVMDLVKGVPITKYCDEHHFTPRQRLELFIPVCHAIQHAHQKGIIHRDLKPSNVLVALYDGRPVPKVIDFGVAKAAGQPLTEQTLVTGFGAIVGTLEYMSPEQAEINQLDIDTRSDIYSLGVLLYELLTGSPPFTRKDLEKAGMMEMLRVIREQEPSKPSTKLSTAEGLPTLAANRGMEPAKLTKLVRGELDWIVMKALEKDRNRRYETANGFAMDVQRYLADEPVLACPPSAGYRLRKFARRNKGGLALAALVLFFLVLLGSGVGWAVRDRSAREAEAAQQQAERQGKVAGQVESIFAEVNRLEEEQKWPEALAAARRAAAAVAGGEADAETAERVRQRLKEIELIDQLERMRVPQHGTMRDVRLQGTNVLELDQNYARAFRDYGVDVDELAVEESIQRLKTRPALAIPLGVALDEWGAIRRGPSKSDDGGWKRLVAIAHGVDPDPLRDRLRSISWPVPPETQEELRRLADSIDVRAHHPSTLMRLAHSVQDFRLAIRILQDAQVVYPGDYWLNSELGIYMDQDVRVFGFRNRNLNGVIRFYTAAVALRPSNAGYIYPRLSMFLRASGDLDQAIAVLRWARPEVAAGSWSEIGDILRDQKKPAEAADAYRRAIAAYRQAFEARPDAFEHHVNAIGKILRGQGKPDEEIAFWRQAMQARPDAADICWRALGDALRAQGKLDEAVAAYRQAVAVYPQALEARPEALDAYWRAIRYWRAIGDTLIAQGKADEAVLAYRQLVAAYRHALDARPHASVPERITDPVLALGPTLIAQVAQGKADEAVAIYQLAVEAVPERAAKYFHAIGDIRYGQKKLNEAVKAYRKAIELKSDAPGHHHSLGLALRDQNKRAEANAAFDKAIELFRQAPLSASRDWNVGVILRDKGDLDGAIAAFRKAVEIAPSSSSLQDLANALRARGRPDEALDVYRKAIQADPKHFELYRDVGKALEQQNKLDEAVAVYRQEAEHAPNSNRAAAAYHRIGIVRHRQKRMPEAIAAYYREIELDPNYSAAGAYINLGNVLKEWGKVDDAVAAYRKAIEINQPYALVAGYYSLGIALSQQNKLDEAAAVFRKGIEINQPAQGLSALHRGLGDVLLQQNKYDEAIVAYRMAIKLQPDSSPRSHCNLAWALATRPEPHLRDPKQAVALAKRAVEQTPDSLTWQYLGWVLYRTGDWKASIEALEKSCKLQEGGSGDYGQWIVLALAHAKLAAQEGLPEKERELHRTEARRRFDEAGKQIDSRWRARPSNVFVRAVWDFREEARELMGAKKKKKK